MRGKASFEDEHCGATADEVVDELNDQIDALLEERAKTAIRVKELEKVCKSRLEREGELTLLLDEERVKHADTFNRSGVILGQLEALYNDVLAHGVGMMCEMDKAERVIAWAKGEHLTNGTPCWCDPVRGKP